MIPSFHKLLVKSVSAEAAGAVAVTFAIAPELRDRFGFSPGQFLTLRANIEGTAVRRSYSICSSTDRFDRDQEIEVGIKPVPGGVFSNWAVNLRPGDNVEVMPPEGRFTPRAALATRSMHRVGFAAGSGITPILSILRSTLQADPDCRFSLVYGNQRLGSIMFNEALQDLKDSYPARLTLIHLLSRQAQEVALFNGRIDAGKLSQLLASLLPAADMDEVFICGPQGMIETVEHALLGAGVSKQRIHAERFFVDGAPPSTRATSLAATGPDPQPADCSLQVVLDGKTHTFALSHEDKVLDIALAAGLDLPYACRGGVCCTCRARVLEGKVRMEKNFTLEQWEVDKGFVLTCQSRPLTRSVVVSYDER